MVRIHVRPLESFRLSSKLFFIGIVPFSLLTTIEKGISYFR